jgi:hypothetical protein
MDDKEVLRRDSRASQKRRRESGAASSSFWVPVDNEKNRATVSRIQILLDTRIEFIICAVQGVMNGTKFVTNWGDKKCKWVYESDDPRIGIPTCIRLKSTRKSPVEGEFLTTYERCQPSVPGAILAPNKSDLLKPSPTTPNKSGSATSVDFQLTWLSILAADALPVRQPDGSFRVVPITNESPGRKLMIEMLERKISHIESGTEDYTCSHRCGVNANTRQKSEVKTKLTCFSPDHLLLESHTINLSRINCQGAIMCDHCDKYMPCVHQPRNSASSRFCITALTVSLEEKGVDLLAFIKEKLAAH